jgi:hypothetical protein
MLLIVSETSMKGEWLKNAIFKGVQRESRESQRLLFPVNLVRESKFDEWDLTDHESGRNFGRELKKHFIPSFYGWEHDNDLYLRELKQLVATLKSTDTGRSCQL